MKLHYMGKFDLNPDSLPHGEHKPGAVKFKEPEDSKTLGIVVNVIAVIIYLVTLPVLFLRGGLDAYNIWGVLASLLTLMPHEFLHAICFKEDAYIYTNIKQGMLFVVGPEDMSKSRYVFLSLLPNLVFGCIPFLLFLINPELDFLGTLGAMAIPMGAGDYMNVFHALTQMPKGARTYLYKFNSYWYMP